jgi:hypothetical protein
MAKKTTRSKRDEQMQVLDLLRAVLPKVAPDPARAETGAFRRNYLCRPLSI